MLARNSTLARRLRALRRDAALRRDEGVFLAEGMHLASEALSGEAAIELAVVSPRLAQSAEGRALVARLSAAGVELHETAETVLDSLQDARSPQPVLLLVRRRAQRLAQCIESNAGPPLLVVAHGIQDPGNLGGILRTADAGGASGCVITGASADLFHPRTVRASMGSIFRLPALVAVPAELLELLRQHEIPRLATSPHSGSSFRDWDFSTAAALFLGGEGAGLPESLTAELDGVLRIPMRDGVESLSVGAAAAVLLFEAQRQRSAQDS